MNPVVLIRRDVLSSVMNDCISVVYVCNSVCSDLHILHCCVVLVTEAAATSWQEMASSSADVSSLFCSSQS